jgi:hypothetical protein
MDWEKIKPCLWSAAGGAVLLAVVGFNWGGWVTGGTADAMAKEMAVGAVAERLGLICVAQSNQDPAKAEKIKELTKKDSWDKGRYIETQGWATMPGEGKPDSKVADACANHIIAKL